MKKLLTLVIVLFLLGGCSHYQNTSSEWNVTRDKTFTNIEINYRDYSNKTEFSDCEFINCSFFDPYGILIYRRCGFVECKNEPTSGSCIEE